MRLLHYSQHRLIYEKYRRHYKSSKKYNPPYYFNRIIIPKIITRMQKIIKQHFPKYKRVDYHTNQTSNTQQ